MPRHTNGVSQTAILRVLALACAGLCLLASPAQAARAARTTAAADDPRVTVDVGVFDAQGRPVSDLTAADFTIRVKGQPRKVVSAEFVAANPDDNANSTTPRRWIVIAIDEASLFKGTEKELQDVASRVLDRLTASDRVAIMSLPSAGEYTRKLSADLHEAQTAISHITGVRLPELLHADMTFGEALSIADESDTRAFSVLTNRSCVRRAMHDDCVRTIAEAAGAAAVSLQSQAKPVFVALVQITDQMRELPGSKTIILISAGTAFSQRWASLEELARRAAISEVTVQAVLVETKDQRRGRIIVQNPVLDRRVFMQRLELVAAAARGAVYRATPQDGEVFDRLMQETTGWYRLEIEPAPRDTGAAINNANISVARNDVTVRARPLLLRGGPDRPPLELDTTAGAGPLDTSGTAGASDAPGAGRATAAHNGAAGGAAGSGAAASGTAGGGLASASGGAGGRAATGSGAVGAGGAGAGATGAGGAPGAAGGGGGSGVAMAIVPASLASLAVSIAPPFARDQVLAPPVLGAFLDQLLNRQGKPSPALAAAVKRVRAGDLTGAASASPDLAKADPAAAAFLKGLSLFAQPDLDAAAVQFRETLRNAPEFYPAVFYLGACYAAGHRDREAAGAWQTTLITQSDMPTVYLLLADAWLRMRDAGRATDFLDEAAEHWPQDVALLKRRVPAALLAGQPAAALAVIDRLLAPASTAPASSPASSSSSAAATAADPEMLFAGIRLLHDAVLAKQPIVSPDDDRRRAQRYAEAYRAANGLQQEQVTHWLAEMPGH
jgi:VWFA-related protein